MKRIGILGGMSWESSAVYYRRLNELVQAARGGVASADIVMHSFDFAELDALQHAERWDEIAELLGNAAFALKQAGAQFIAIATNTMHLVADRIEQTAGIPVLHIADATGDAIAEAGYSSVALLGTKFTMERAFYRDRLRQRSGVEVLVPNEEERDLVHRIIYKELCAGVQRDESRAEVSAVIERLAANGAQAAVLGCTELPLLVADGDAAIPVIDTMEIHVQAIARTALD